MIEKKPVNDFRLLREREIRDMSYAMRLGKEPEHFLYKENDYIIFPLLFISYEICSGRIVLRFHACELDAKMGEAWLKRENIIVKSSAYSGCCYYLYKNNNDLLGNARMKIKKSTDDERFAQGLVLHVSPVNDITVHYNRAKKIANIL